MNNHYQEIIRDISLLYELSLSIGTSLDLRENCDTFLNKLLARENFAFASVWIKDEYLTGKHDSEATLVYANPEYRVRDTKIPLSNTVFSLIKEKGPIIVSNQDASFQEIITEKRITKGVFYIFPLGDIGFLKVYSAFGKKENDEATLNKLINVISKFTVSVEACLYHERVLREVAQRKRAENELRISEKRFKDMAELLPEMVYECDLKGNFRYVNKSGLRMLGFSQEDLDRGLNISELIPDYQQNMFSRRFAELLASKELPPAEYNMLTKNGRSVSVLKSSTVISNFREIVGIRGVVVDITEKKRMQDSLLDAKMIAVANRVKNDFFSNMSHELRTPLNSIIGFSAVLEDKTFGELTEEQSCYVQYIHSSGQRLLEVITDLLSISRMGTQDIEVTPENFDIMRAVVEVTEAFKPLILREKVRIGVVSRTDVEEIHADRSKFKQIMYNLISCILKHRGEKQDICLELDVVSNILRINIKESQKVFTPYEIERIIDIFNKDVKTMPMDNEVLELELMITKRFVELHGGSIWFETNSQENSFSFILPVDVKKEKQSELILA